MPLQNRVLPTGEIVADPARGTLTGNRGVLAFEGDRLGRARWTHPHWILCTLEHPRGLYHGPRPKNRWTPLFFLDEAVGIDAGHRPCGYCRRAAYRRFRAAWEAAVGPVAGVDALDRRLHAARVTRTRRQVTHRADAAALPDGAFIAFSGGSWLVLGAKILRFTPAGYTERRARPTGAVTVLTPVPSVAALGAGYRPGLHESALA
ncbi:MAG: hypothetical protein KDK53_24565 [Maritimibacter sp.]|nr:hypothetical protein [Maritimibacter sp.]